MNGPSAIRRNLLMHPAHRSVGVSGPGKVFHPYCTIRPPSADGLAIEPIRVRLVARPSHSGALAALAALEAIVRRQSGMVCERADFNPFEATGENRSFADCVVVFARGLYVVGRGADCDAESFMENGPKASAGNSTEVEIAVAASRHPVLDRVGPFFAQSLPPSPDDVPRQATCLLVGKTGDEVLPVAWAGEFPGKLFHTSFGAAEDFRLPDFVRLVLNAIEWAGS